MTDEIRETLGEAIHTAFRKGSDHPDAVRVWRLINRMPYEEWAAIIDFIADGLEPAIQARVKREKLADG